MSSSSDEPLQHSCCLLLPGLEAADGHDTAVVRVVLAQAPSVIVRGVEEELLALGDGELVLEAANKSNLDTHHHAVLETSSSGCSTSTGDSGTCGSSTADGTSSGTGGETVVRGGWRRERSVDWRCRSVARGNTVAAVRGERLGCTVTGCAASSETGYTSTSHVLGVATCKVALLSKAAVLGVLSVTVLRVGSLVVHVVCVVGIGTGVLVRRKRRLGIHWVCLFSVGRVLGSRSSLPWRKHGRAVGSPTSTRATTEVGSCEETEKSKTSNNTNDNTGNGTCTKTGASGSLGRTVASGSGTRRGGRLGQRIVARSVVWDGRSLDDN